MISRIDGWLARTIFWPIIIKVCQEVGCTKWAFGRTCAFLWGCCFILTVRVWDAFQFTVATGVAISGVLDLGLLQDTPYPEFGFLRFMWWGVFFIELLGALAFGWGWLRVTGLIAMLFSCYAATLPTVPPKRRKGRNASRRAMA